MNNDSPHQTGNADPGTGKEIWISRTEVKRLFPGVHDRQLKYWRDTRKIRFKTIRNQAFYIESEVRQMAKWNSRPLKYIRLRSKWVYKKLGTINPVLGITVVTVLYLLAINKSYLRDPNYSFWDVALPFLFLLFFCFVYGIVRLIQYLWKRIFSRKQHTK